MMTPQKTTPPPKKKKKPPPPLPKFKKNIVCMELKKQKSCPCKKLTQL